MSETTEKLYRTTVVIWSTYHPGAGDTAVEALIADSGPVGTGFRCAPQTTGFLVRGIRNESLRAFFTLDPPASVRLDVECEHCGAKPGVKCDHTCPALAYDPPDDMAPDDVTPDDVVPNAGSAS